MKILDIILRLLGAGAGEAPDLAEKLRRIREAAPDVAPQVDEVLAVLETSVSQENLLSVGPDVVGALFDVARGRFKPVKGAGDAI